jgi:hypothetical protein
MFLFSQCMWVQEAKMRRKLEADDRRARKQLESLERDVARLQVHAL